MLGAIVTKCYEECTPVLNCVSCNLRLLYNYCLGYCTYAAPWPKLNFIFGYNGFFFFFSEIQVHFHG
jgi:hypothetical protein